MKYVKLEEKKYGKKVTKNAQKYMWYIKEKY